MGVQVRLLNEKRFAGNHKLPFAPVNVARQGLCSVKEIEKHAMGSEAKGPGFSDNRIWTSDISKTKTTERYEINPTKLHCNITST